MKPLSIIAIAASILAGAAAAHAQTRDPVTGKVTNSDGSSYNSVTGRTDPPPPPPPVIIHSYTEFTITPTPRNRRY